MIGHGVYTISEAVKYIGMPAQTLRTWFIGRSDGKGGGPLFKSDYKPVEGDYAISFLNLIEARIARIFRERGFPNRRIRIAHKNMKNRLNTEYPFAHAALSSSGKEMYWKTDDGEIIDPTTMQYLMRQVKKLDFDYGKITKQVEVWPIAKGVLLNPKVNWGKSIIKGTGISTEIIARQYCANGNDAKLVARLYNISKSNVHHAYEFERSIKSIAA